MGDAQPRRENAVFRISQDFIGEGGWRNDHQVHVNRQGMFPIEFQQQMEITLERNVQTHNAGIGEETGVVDGGDAVRGEGLRGEAKGLGDLCVRGRGHVLQNEFVRAFEQNARWGTVRQPPDLAARRIGRLDSDACDTQRRFVCPAAVTIDADQVDGMIGRGAIEQLARGQVLLSPGVLAPAVAENPGAFRHAGGALGYKLGNFLFRPGFRQVEEERLVELVIQQREADVEQVNVMIVQAGHQNVALEIDQFRSFAAGLLHVAHRAHRQDFSFADGDGVDVGMGGIEGENRPVMEDDSRRALSRARSVHGGDGEYGCEE